MRFERERENSIDCYYLNRNVTFFFHDLHVTYEQSASTDSTHLDDDERRDRANDIRGFAERKENSLFPSFQRHDRPLACVAQISLHQLEIEKIEAIGDCKKLKILYLQNNIIGKIENLSKLKDLEYLNMALNNVTRIEGLRQCEFLKKLDLTVNFVDLDVFEESIEELKFNTRLKELYMLGNPALDWAGANDFIIASLPSLETLDGRKITKSTRLAASQRMNALRSELRRKAVVVAKEKRLKRESKVHDDVDGGGEYTPESRLDMYREVAEEKQEKEDREKEMRPKERDYEQEHQKAVSTERAYAEENGKNIRQCNHGGYEFTIDEDDDNIYFEVAVPKNLSTALIDANTYPTYVSVVIKQKVLRISFPAEVRSDSAKAERSLATGRLKITAPKVVRGSNFGFMREEIDDIDYDLRRSDTKKRRDGEKEASSSSRKKTLAQEILESSRSPSSSNVSFRNIVNKDNRSETLFAKRPSATHDDDEPPPLE